MLATCAYCLLLLLCSFKPLGQAGQLAAARMLLSHTGQITVPTWETQGSSSSVPSGSLPVSLLPGPPCSVGLT